MLFNDSIDLKHRFSYW